MVSAIQAVPIFNTAYKPTSAGQAFTLADGTKSSLSVPGVTLTLSDRSQATLTYNQAGLFAPSLQAVTTITAATLNAAIDAALASPPLPASSNTPNTASTNTPPAAATAAPAQPATASTAVATATTAPIAVAPVAGIAGTTPGTAIALAANFFVNPADQVLANITANPAYAGMAAALYVNVAVYRSCRPRPPSWRTGPTSPGR
ncbi:hypothetical protein [Propionivibrio sp.]|uniref:hypothetical protein n=1 Tax=Propionivibrio sp. TaxID=2212460 RepID=UPI003BF0AA63